MKRLFPAAPGRALTAAALIGLTPLAAHAYVDPASGAMLLQGLVALIAVLVAFIRNPVKTVKSWFAKREPAPKDDVPPPKG